VSHGLQLTECTKSTQDAQARERERGKVSLVVLDERRKGKVNPVAPDEKRKRQREIFSFPTLTYIN